jgi:uncharacterized membrane-anchored protein YhcB (DUF1043 family)
MIPILIGAAAIGLGAMGIKKGIDAKEKNEEAEWIVERAQSRFENIKKELEEEAEVLRNYLIIYGEFKVNIFKEVIGNFLNLMKECSKNTKSEANIRKYINENEMIELEEANIEAVKISDSLAESATTGILTAFGIYGTVGTLATASTGTAIASLSGAAATNATLAWLGGGSLAAGGFGIAGGTAVLGGLIAGPAIAMAGFAMDSKAEKNLTKAIEFEKEVDEKIEKILESIEEYHIIEKYIEESKEVLENLVSRYQYIYENLLNEREILYKKLYNEYLEKKEKMTLFQKFLTIFRIGKIEEPVKPALCQLENFQGLLIIVKSIKDILQAPLLDKDGNRNKNFIEIVDQIKLEYKG